MYTIDYVYQKQKLKHYNEEIFIKIYQKSLQNYF